jgi:hypothetical protein
VGATVRQIEQRIERFDEAVLRAPGTRRVLRPLGLVSSAGLLALFAFGILMLATLFRWWIVPVVVIVGAGIPIALCLKRGARRGFHVAAILLPAILVPVVGLLGFDVLWASVGLKRPGPLLGLAIASVVVGGLAYLYLSWLRKPPPAHPVGWAAFGAVAGLVLFVVTRKLRVPEWEILLTAAVLGVATWGYLRIVAGPKIRYPLWWALLLALAVVFAVPLVSEAKQRGDFPLRGLGLDAIAAFAAFVYARRLAREHPKEQTAARRLLWPMLGLAALIVAAGIYAKATGVPGEEPVGAPIPAAVAGAKVPQDAIDHRPLLVFDSGEILRTPVDIDDLFRSGLVERCPEGKGLLVDCPALSSVDALTTDNGNLRFRTESFDNGSFDTRIYVHVMADKLDARLLDLDYWWYLPDNPANTARGAMCGAGLVIPEITCFDHQSDWEGVTVVVEKDTHRPVAVHYAAHKFVVKVPWEIAERAARKSAPGLEVSAGELADRPLVFVARGTHAAYPQACTKEFCRTGSFSNDNQFDGKNAWPENDCVPCLALFPVTATGAPASWNAFKGHWGSALCVVVDVWCARSEAPRAPAAQKGRFAHPWCYTHVVGRRGVEHPAALKAADVPDGCPKPKK